MKKFFIALIALAGFVATSKAQTSVFNFTELTHDFGDVPKGPDLNYEFTFTNTGTEPIVISAVRGSCSCTKGEFDATPVAPGATGKIKAIFETKDKEGKFNKSLYIFSNASAEPFELTIKGNVIAPPADMANTDKPVAVPKVEAKKKTSPAKPSKKK